MHPISVRFGGACMRLSSNNHFSSSSSSPFSGATIAPFESFGLFNYFLPFNPILDAFSPIIYFYNSYIFFDIVFPSNFWSSCEFVMTVSTQTIF